MLPKKTLSTLICLLGASFYLYEFVLQVSPNVIATELMRDLQLEATGLGFLSASYFYAYMLMQFPAGILYDRYGPRLLLTIMTAICALGALLFSCSDQLFITAIGRGLMGFGSAFAFIGALVLVSRWFPAAYFPTITGIVQAMSSVGAIMGTIPLAAAIASFGWRPSIMALAVIGFGLALLIWSIVRDNPTDSTNTKPLSYFQEWHRLLIVCKNSQTWLVGIYAFAMWAPIIVFAELWGSIYLQKSLNLNPVAASSYITLIWVGIAVGSPIIGIFSQSIKQRRLPLLWMATLGLITSILLISCPEYLSSAGLYLVMFCLGFSASGCILTFSVVKENNHSDTLGSAIGFNNMMVVAGGALLQPLAGIILQLFWDGQIIDSIPVYSIQAFQLSLVTIPLCYMIAIGLVLFGIHESHRIIKVTP